MSLKITEMWAYICTADDGGEGIPAITLGQMHHPLVGTDPEHAQSFRDEAAAVAKMTGRPVRLVRFTCMETVETIDP